MDAMSEWICRCTGAERVIGMRPLQSLWGGYGRLLRCTLKGGDWPTVIAKDVRFPADAGRKASLDHRRKERSYQTELNFYQDWASRLDENCRVAHCLGQREGKDGVWLLLEDLDAAGFAGRRRRGGDAEIHACLSWLARFHATFLGESPRGLWPQGTYWHLGTRPDELRAVPDPVIRKAASLMDRELHGSRFRTFVHGDAKVDNFCFNKRGDVVAGVDFQYVGGGMGMQDVVYCIDSCYSGSEAERLAEPLQAYYFTELHNALRQLGKNIDGAALEADWRRLYNVAWADYYRFLAGWNSAYADPSGYAARTARAVAESLLARSSASAES